ncbi:N-formylglutamate deformylase [Acidocella sp.]|uniref:N-formylglutamate deformylase n=1 Tax=Acidocella sp. TaxID=50710 RepID=UPI0026302B55|nr:N-formylglutamate deformylase [Acidocella sp.]
MSLFALRRGNAPLILSMPHAGTEIPGEFAGVFVSDWLARKDTDWHLPALYAFAVARDATILAARVSRSVIDLNRDPSGASLYPGQTTTALCPGETFDGEKLYPGAPPDAAEIARRREKYFAPYHAALQSEITRLRARHGQITLYDCHSIRSEVPRLFPDVLPHFNIGTNGGASCAPELAARVVASCAVPGFSHVLNGRFKGGWITRHYGQPAQGVHAIQMELACRGYMDEPAVVSPANWPGAFNPSAPILPVLQTVIESLLP